jgi:hypothetical protein
MLTPTKKELLIFNSLSQTQKTLATGHVSDPPVLHGNDNAHSLSYFDKDLTKLIQKISLSLSSANAILFANKTGSFRILSSPWIALDSSNCKIFMGQDGNQAMQPDPISILASDATMNIMICIIYSSNPEDPLFLHHLMASWYMASWRQSNSLQLIQQAIWKPSSCFPMRLCSPMKPLRMQSSLPSLFLSCCLQGSGLLY